MKILWLRPDKPENISVSPHRLAAELRDRGHEVTVQNASLFDWWSVLHTPADVVVGITRLGAVLGAWRSLVVGTPLVVDHIDPIEQFRRNHGRLSTTVVAGMEAASFRIADHVVVIYERERPRVERHSSAVTKSSLGVDFERFDDPGPAVCDRARTMVEGRFDSGRKTLLYVGGLEPAYNIQTLVDAMAYLPEWDLLVLGDGSQREVVEEAAAANVYYLGTVPHEAVPGYMHASDVGISLVDDSHTLKVLEYGAAGLPAVSLDGEPRDRFGDALTYCTLDPEDVARAVTDADRMGPNDALREIAWRHRWDVIADEYEAVLESVTARD